MAALWPSARAAEDYLAPFVANAAELLRRHVGTGHSKARGEARGEERLQQLLVERAVDEDEEVEEEGGTAVDEGEGVEEVGAMAIRLLNLLYFTEHLLPWAMGLRGDRVADVPAATRRELPAHAVCLAAMLRV